MTRCCPVWPKIDSQRGALLDPPLRAHLADCAACAAEWEAVERLARAARDLLRGEPDPERMEQVRTLLLAAARQRPAPRRALHRFRAWLVVAAAALLVALGSAFAYRTSGIEPPAGPPPPRNEAALNREPVERVEAAVPSASASAPQAVSARPVRSVGAGAAVVRAGGLPEARRRAAPGASGAARPAHRSYAAVDPSEAAFAEGFQALDRGELGRAEKELGRAAGEATGRLSEDAAFWHAVVLARSGNRDRAAGAFSEFLARYPSSPRRGEASVLLGRLLLDAGNAGEAKRHFAEAAADRRPDVRAAARRGRDQAAQTLPRQNQIR